MAVYDGPELKRPIKEGKCPRNARCLVDESDRKEDDTDDGQDQTNNPPRNNPHDPFPIAGIMSFATKKRSGISPEQRIEGAMYEGPITGDGKPSNSHTQTSAAIYGGIVSGLQAAVLGLAVAPAVAVCAVVGLAMDAGIRHYRWWRWWFLPYPVCRWKISK